MGVGGVTDNTGGEDDVWYPGCHRQGREQQGRDLQDTLLCGPGEKLEKIVVRRRRRWVVMD